MLVIIKDGVVLGQCRKCKKLKPKSEYSMNSKGNALRSTCDVCRAYEVSKPKAAVISPEEEYLIKHSAANPTNRS